VIVTNHHVVADADDIQVELQDGRKLDARVIGTDPSSDLAVLRVAADHLTTVPIGDSSRLRVGDLVLAIGNPFGVGEAVTMGIVSAVGRANVGIADYENFIQTDAAINPGNSGGALVDMNGALVGINTAIASRSGGYQGVGFAIPSSMMVQVEDAIVREGKVTRSWLGVAVQDLTPELAAVMKLDGDHGVIVADVTGGGPAAKAGIRRGDVITAIDGTETRDAAQLRNLIAMAGKGKQVEVALRRDGKERTVEATLAELPAAALPPAPTPGRPSAPMGRGPLEGVAVAALDPAARARLGLEPDVAGVLVTDVDPASAAARAGVRPGDVIVEIDRAPTSSPEAFEAAARASGGRTLVLVNRGGGVRYLVIGAP
jgi:serine protease Do